MKPILFSVGALIGIILLIGFTEPDYIKPMNIKTVIEYKYYAFGNGKASELKKFSVIDFDKTGRLLKKIVYDNGTDTSFAFIVIYDKSLKPVKWRYFLSKHYWKEEIVQVHGDTADVTNNWSGEEYQDHYIFNKRYEVTRFWSDEPSTLQPSYSVNYTDGKLSYILYEYPILSAQSYTYRKDSGTNLTIRDKFAEVLQPMEASPSNTKSGKKEKKPKENVFFNSNNEMIKKLVYQNKGDTTFYTYKYEYFKK